MSHYIGTQAECEQYNSMVTTSENYDGVNTLTWSEVIKHPTEDMWRINKHDNYTSTMQEVQELSSDWLANDII